ncbi:MAG: hypothetical protein ABIW38_07535 [Ferruginibacter sp.]
MLKIFLSLIAITILYSFSYAQPALKSTLDFKKDKNGMSPKANDCEYYADKATAEKMMRYYNDFLRPKNIQTDFVIERCVFESIKNFFDANPNVYDGIRFFLGARKNWFLGKTYSTFFIVPTIKNEPYPSIHQHTNNWGNIINYANCNSNEVKLNTSKNDASSEINKYGKKFRKEQRFGDRESAPEKNDHLSLGIWISQCKIDTICKILNTHPDLPGVKAIAAAYYEKGDITRRSNRKHDIQSTFIFVPIDNIGNPIWSVVPKPPAFKILEEGGLNHGQLCPQICD